jgi:hypothetical protein
MTTIKQLIENHENTCKLYGVSFSGKTDEHGDIINTMVFVLDGVGYLAKENSDDGYRSTCSEIEEVEAYMCNNLFQACEVRLSHNESDGDQENDLLVGTDIKTHKVVFTVGTENTNDYYPCCIMTFDPTSMAINDKAQHCLHSQMGR